MLDGLDYVLLRLGGHQLTMGINKALRKADLKALESNLRGHRIPRHVIIPQDERLRQMLDSDTTSASGSSGAPAPPSSN